MTFVYILLAILVVASVYVRFAPTPVARFHQISDFDTDATEISGVKRVMPGDVVTLAKLDKIILATPRTQVVAGSAEAGFVTYVTRSRLIGFPDYATVQLDDGVLKLHSRLRFGRSDLGVNGKRVKAWIDALGAM
ncbi:DUF1499 domain-containing protein [Cognatishimia sp.]|uniref:DUF1499 domain-containing protein n=1 Tax=Cognatishimia sp. TaxID=2211648 RepID=UPI003515770C